MAKVSAVTTAYEWLRDGIVLGTLEPGAFIDEATVVEAAGISRTPVREAFHRLAGEGFVELVPRRGAQVRRLTAEDVSEIYSARRLLETHAAQEICLRRIIPPQDRIDDLIARQEALLIDSGVSNPAEFSDLDRMFHRTYIEAEGNSLLINLYDSMWPQHERLAMRQGQLLSASEIREIIDQHRGIADAIRRFDADEASRLIEIHLQPARARIG